VTVFNLDTTSGSLQTIKVMGSSDNEVTVSADVVHLAAGVCDSRAVVWTYVYPGTHFIISYHISYHIISYHIEAGARQTTSEPLLVGSRWD